MKLQCIASLLLLSCISLCAGAGSQMRTVESTFERCESVMERVKRDMLRFEEEVERLRRSFDAQAASADDKTAQAILKLENRVDYLRGRIDRTASQRDKVRNDLKNISGPICPTCVSTAVDLYCRNSESLTREIETARTDASALHDKIGHVSPSATSEEGRRQSANTDSLHTALRKAGKNANPRMDSCKDGSAVTLWNQFRINLNRADSLKTAGTVGEEYTQTLHLAQLLLQKALSKCSSE